MRFPPDLVLILHRQKNATAFVEDCIRKALNPPKPPEPEKRESPEIGDWKDVPDCQSRFSIGLQRFCFIYGKHSVPKKVLGKPQCVCCSNQRFIREDNRKTRDPLVSTPREIKTVEYREDSRYRIPWEQGGLSPFRTKTPRTGW